MILYRGYILLDKPSALPGLFALGSGVFGQFAGIGLELRDFVSDFFCGILHLIAAAIPVLFWKLSDRDADAIRERIKARNAANEA